MDSTGADGGDHRPEVEGETKLLEALVEWRLIATGLHSISLRGKGGPRSSSGHSKTVHDDYSLPAASRLLASDMTPNLGHGSFSATGYACHPDPCFLCLKRTAAKV
jgi:hypothetical protein